MTKSTCAWLRWSHQISDGRITWLRLIQNHQAVHLPGKSDALDRPRRSRRPCASTPRMASTTASHQFSGRCSAHMRARHLHVFVERGESRADARRAHPPEGRANPGANVYAKPHVDIVSTANSRRDTDAG